MLANPEGDPDPDLDLAGHEKPKWTQYSLRRAGERSARNNQHRHGLPRAEIDLYSGWDLYEHSRDMQHRTALDFGLAPHLVILVSPCSIHQPR